MATKIKYEAFKRGDTPVFQFDFSEPSDGFDWSGVTLDAAMTIVEAPANNTGAAVLRTNQSLTVNDDNSATYSLIPTVLESKALLTEKYKVEVQLKDGAGANVATAVTGEVEVLQDYII